ncbi:MAG TPA: zinc-dependent metalloprotease [Saprospiraceae bacterium]|nr:zinc-dependent metalloprotease [Saprospiraceae bacterium]
MGSFNGLIEFKIGAHELGHTLSLIHTHGGGDVGILSNPLSWECKDGSNWDTTGDKIMDTPADPLSQDINPADGLPDAKLNCDENPPANVKDKCMDVTTPWHVPFHNVMSYYFCPPYEFSTCQKVAMHNRLELVSKLKLDCSEDLYNDPPCADIEISQNTTWSNQVIHMCPGQKIIILPNVTLTIENCTITKGDKQAPNPNCPTLVNNGAWDGIYLGDVSVGPGFNFGLVVPGYSGNNLIIRSGSRIEYSKNGIVGNSNFGNILVENSTFEHNGRIAKLNGSGNLNINNSSLKVDKPSDVFHLKIYKDQIHCIRSGVSLYNTSFEMVEQSTSVIGINSINGRVSTNKSTFKNFNIGIFKDLGGSLSVVDCDFLTCYDFGIKNMCNSVVVKKSYADCNIGSFGVALGTYYNNHFKDDLVLNNVQKSNKISENYFTSQINEAIICLTKDNALSDAVCNTWKGSIAVESDASRTPMDWGSENVPSGNRWTASGVPPTMSSEIDLTNWEKKGDVSSVFTYLDHFYGDKSNSNTVLCTYPPAPLQGSNIPGGSTGGGDQISVDWQSLDAAWTGYQQQINGLQASLSGQGSAQDTALLLQIEDLQVAMGQVVNEALQAIHQASDILTMTTWMNRAGTEASLYISMMNALLASDWPQAASIATVQTSDDINVLTDKLQLMSIINYLSALHANGVALAGLDSVQLNHLIDLSDDSYGDYTACVRTLINLLYDIQVSDPSLQNRSRGLQSPGKTKLSANDKSLIIYPNPTSGVLQLSYPVLSILHLELIDAKGRVQIERRNFQGKDLDISSLSSGTYYLRYKLDEEGKSEIQTIVKMD